jgi:homoserine dehydrogenase
MNKVALLGYGTVGKGVKEILDSLADVELVKVFDLPSKKTELGSLLVTDYHAISEDESIDTVFECLGGDTLPHEAILACLKAGKNVISSNKETISLHFKEYLATAKKHHGTLQEEASVGGGIPLLYPLNVIAHFDTVTSLRGILNGTSNYILTAMQDKGLSFDDALGQAQAKGFAEKDPTADLEGLDLLRKCAILASILYHQEIDSLAIPHFGISHLEKRMLDDFKKERRVLRFLVDIHPYQSSLSLSVMPVLLKEDDPLAQVKEETNAVSVNCLKNGPLTFIGKGAGKNPTASAMISDFERVCSGGILPVEDLQGKAALKPDLEGTYYAYGSSKSLQILTNPSLEELKSYAFVAKLA